MRFTWRFRRRRSGRSEEVGRGQDDAHAVQRPAGFSSMWRMYCPSCTERRCIRQSRDAVAGWRPRAGRQACHSAAPPPGQRPGSMPLRTSRRPCPDPRSFPARMRRSTVRRSAGVMALAPPSRPRRGRPASHRPRPCGGRGGRGGGVLFAKAAWNASYGAGASSTAPRTGVVPDGRVTEAHDSMSLMLRRSRKTWRASSRWWSMG